MMILSQYHIFELDTINIYSAYSIKLPSAVKRASILGLKLIQAFARVSLAKEPITCFIFWIRSLDLLWNFALTLNSETPHTKKSKGLQSGELGSQTSSTHTSVRFSLSQFCISFMLCPAQSVQTITALVASWRFSFAGMCLFIFIYASGHSWDGLGQKNFSKKWFLMWQWSFESVPEISLPPCTVHHPLYYKYIL